MKLMQRSHQHRDLSHNKLSALPDNVFQQLVELAHVYVWLLSLLPQAPTAAASD